MAKDDRMTQYVFGPVPSRRFGNSLGVNPIPMKVCSYSCVYCQLGRTKRPEIERKQYFETKEVVSSILRAIDAAHGMVDFATFMGDGEPTLALNLGEMAQALRGVWDGKISLITNGSLFFLSDVRKDAMRFNVVSPTIAVGDERTFRKIHRAHKKITLELVSNGLRQFSVDFSGELWIEIMLVRDLNDSAESLKSIRDIVESLEPSRIYLNAPIRPPSEPWVKIPSRESIELALELLPDAIDMTRPEEGEFIAISESKIEALLEIAKNHPLREDQAMEILSDGRDALRAAQRLEQLVSEGKLKQTEYEGRKFFRTI